MTEKERPTDQFLLKHKTDPAIVLCIGFLRDLETQYDVFYDYYFRRMSEDYKFITSQTMTAESTYSYIEKYVNLEGMLIKSTKPISVYYVSMNPEPDHDHTFLSVPPVKILGKKHFIPPIEGREEMVGYITKVLAAHDNTKITYGSEKNGSLNRYYILMKMFTSHIELIG